MAARLWSELAGSSGLGRTCPICEFPAPETLASFVAAAMFHYLPRLPLTRNPFFCGRHGRLVDAMRQPRAWACPPRARFFARPRIDALPPPRGA
eukprot:9486646-Pyramimonas_sp.AAC.1